MSYVRFGLMLLTSTVVMFILMYLNTFAWEHILFSETRAYMALMMGATMAVIMLAYMLGMYSNKGVLSTRHHRHCPAGEEANWRENAELVFEPDQGLRVGYRGFYKCGIG